MNKSVFGKSMENVRNHKDIKLVTTDKRRNRLLSEPNYHTTKYFLKNLLAIKMKKKKVQMNNLKILSRANILIASNNIGRVILETTDVKSLKY